MNRAKARRAASYTLPMIEKRTENVIVELARDYMLNMCVQLFVLRKKSSLHVEVINYVRFSVLLLDYAMETLFRGRGQEC